MRLVTQELDPDEKVYRITEVNLVRPPKYQRRRYQVIIVNRNDRLAEWWYDLGPAESFTTQQFTFPMFWEHSVAEAQDIAEAKRNDDYWTKFLAEKRAESTLITDFLNQYEERHRIINNQSTFGPELRKQRIGFPRRKALESLSN